MSIPNSLPLPEAVVIPSVTPHLEHYTRKPTTFADWTARIFVKTIAGFLDFCFQERYTHRAVVLETVAGIPGIVGGLFQHLKSLRQIRTDRGWIRTLLEEAENERVHLLVYSTLAKPNLFEKLMIMIMQVLFFHFYFLMYFISPRFAHRMCGYLEEEAIVSYEHFLQLVRDGKEEDVPAPSLAIEYWKLPVNATLRDVIKATIKDEMHHRDTNHTFAGDF